MNTQLLQDYLNKNIKNQNLLLHMQNVAKVLRGYAQKLGQDDELWFWTGMMHDSDYEVYPDKHPIECVKFLKSIDAPEMMINAIWSHGTIEWVEANGGNIVDSMPRFIPRNSTLDKYLFACDELTGIIWATSLMRPNGLNDLQASSVIKKFKDKNFAKGVNRDDIMLGISEIGITLEEHITNCIEYLKRN